MAFLSSLSATIFSALRIDPSELKIVTLPLADKTLVELFKNTFCASNLNNLSIIFTSPMHKFLYYLYHR